MTHERNDFFFTPKRLRRIRSDECRRGRPTVASPFFLGVFRLQVCMHIESYFVLVTEGSATASPDPVWASAVGVLCFSLLLPNHTRALLLCCCFFFVLPPFP